MRRFRLVGDGELGEWGERQTVASVSAPTGTEVMAFAAGDGEAEADSTPPEQSRYLASRTFDPKTTRRPAPDAFPIVSIKPPLHTVRMVI